MDWNSQIILTTLGGLFMIANSYILYRVKSKDAHIKKELDEEKAEANSLNNRIETFQKDLMEEKAVATERYKELLAKYQQVIDENHKLHKKLQSIKNGLDSAKTFGYGSSIAMWSKDVQGHRINHNKAYEDITGHQFKDCQYKTDFEITDNETLCKVWRRIDLEVIRKQRAIVCIEPCTHKDFPTDIFFVLSYKWPSWSQGRVIGVEGLAIPLPDILDAIRTSPLDLDALIKRHLF